MVLSKTYQLPLASCIKINQFNLKYINNNNKIGNLKKGLRQ